MSFTRTSIAAALCAAVVFSGPGCSKKGGDKAGDDKTVTEGKTAEGAGGAATPDEGAPGKPKAPVLDDPKTLFSEGKPMPAGLLEKIKLGVTATGDVDEYLFAYPPVDVAPGISLYASSESTKREPDAPIAAVAIEFSGEAGNTAKSMATGAWGDPIVAPDNSGTKIDGKVLDADYWFNAEKHIYAKLIEGAPGKFTLSYGSYMPLEELIGAAKEHFGFEAAKPLLGASADDLTSAYGAAFKPSGKGGKVEFLPFEYQHARGKTQVHVKLPEGTVTEYRFTLAYDKGTGDDKQRILDLLKKKYGDPKEEDVSGQKHMVYSEKPRVSVFDQDGIKSLEISVKAVE